MEDDVGVVSRLSGVNSIGVITFFSQLEIIG